ncbi:MAG: stage V sporulation protein AB [Candidatus Cohnella colombiensis]|uniref:Stage V sporulation protein AB n=1 Tax=Candidatus Cohnella colombiensis TaxID=3121368 RepID=A0AA95EY38_9BACL|nr:MAG: stage V sporulation protein AB [Cohnella sp.]
MAGVELLQVCLLALIGLAAGCAAGSAFIALLIVLDLIPRLVQITRAYRRTAFFESAIVAGAMYWIVADFNNWQFWLPPFALLVPAVFQGVFVGMLAAALTEVLNVLPILAKRLKLKHQLLSLLVVMVLGKVVGSLVEWLWL